MIKVNEEFLRFFDYEVCDIEFHTGGEIIKVKNYVYPEANKVVLKTREGGIWYFIGGQITAEVKNGVMVIRANSLRVNRVEETTARPGEMIIKFNIAEWFEPGATDLEIEEGYKSKAAAWGRLRED